MEEKTKKTGFVTKKVTDFKERRSSICKACISKPRNLIWGHLRERAARAHREAPKVPEDVREPLDGRKLQQSGAPASDFLGRCNS